MTPPYPKHEKTKIDEYVEKGFTTSYKMEGGRLLDLDTDILYTADQVTIYDEFRYEGISNPSDMSMMYAITTPNQGKGTLVVPYGAYGNTALSEFMAKVTCLQKK